MSNNYFRPRADSQVQRCSVGGVLDSRVDISRHTDQKQHSLHVDILNGYVQEVASLGVELEILTNLTCDMKEITVVLKIEA